MVDVGEKTPTTRIAVAEGFISLNRLALEQVIQGSHKKGDVIVDHAGKSKGKWDKINLTKKAGAKTIAQGVAATKRYHKKHGH